VGVQLPDIEDLVSSSVTRIYGPQRTLAGKRRLLGELRWTQKKSQKYRQSCSDVRAVGLCPYTDTMQCAAKLSERISKSIHNMFRPDYFISRVIHSESQTSSTITDPSSWCLSEDRLLPLLLFTIVQFQFRIILKQNVVFERFVDSWLYFLSLYSSQPWSSRLFLYSYSHLITMMWSSFRARGSPERTVDYYFQHVRSVQSNVRPVHTRYTVCEQGNLRVRTRAWNTDKARVGIRANNGPILILTVQVKEENKRCIDHLLKLAAQYDNSTNRLD